MARTNTAGREISPSAFDILVVRQEAEDEYILGNLDTGMFVLVDAMGAHIVALLKAGATVEQVHESLLLSTGDDLDIRGFVDGLVDAELIHESTIGEPAAHRTSILSRIPTRLVRPLFARWAWSFYAGCLVATALMFAMEPNLLPDPEALFFVPDVVVSLLCSGTLMVATGVIHEVWHALAGAALGVRSQFRIGRRASFVVFETDLSRMWSVPSRQRYGPLLAGLAIDAVIVFAAVATRFAWSRDLIDPSPTLIRLLGTLVLIQAFRMTFQGLAFMRTDLYLVLATSLGARNLHRVTRLGLRRLIRLPLTATERDELDSAHPRDIALARWYRLFYLIGLTWVTWFIVHYAWPSVKVIVEWSAASMLGSSPRYIQWWEALILLAFEGWFFGTPAYLYVRERLVRRRRGMQGSR